MVAIPMHHVVIYIRVVVIGETNISLTVHPVCIEFL